MKKSDYLPRALEHPEQVALVRRVRKQFSREFPEVKFMYAVPNEKAMRSRAAVLRQMKMKAEGALPGVCDLVLPVPRVRPGRKFVERTYSLGVFMGLYVEMKRPPMVTIKTRSVSYEKPNPDQQKFIDFVRSQGYVAECANGQDEAIEVFEWYLNLRRIPADDLKNDYSHIDNVVRTTEPTRG